ncbi:hypothetical protein [Tsuneonella suprasediminis]|nr:hypothetical protein [Tsuneonella suprasediminis]
MIILSIVGATYAALDTSANILSRRQPDYAVSIAPWNGTTNDDLAAGIYRAQVAETPENPERPSPQAERYALNAYKQAPLSPASLAIISLSKAEPESRELLHLASTISRREPLLQAALLRNYAASGEVSQSIRVLNEILLVRRQQRPQLYQILAGMLENDDSFSAFLEVFRTRPDWMNGFLDYAAQNPRALQNLAKLRARLPNDAIESTTDRTLLIAFARTGDIASAYKLYTHLIKKRTSTKGWDSSVPPFDWALSDKDGFQASVPGDSDDLNISIKPGKGGVFATKIIPVNGGDSLHIQGNFKGTGFTDTSPLEVSVSCVELGSTLGSTQFTSSPIDLSISSIPAECHFAAIILNGRAWSFGGKIKATISPLSITSGKSTLTTSK